ncbi:hypothetical protein CEP54_009113 [Fusarium duplospermum]|uniref:Uncharacterized protein n=1 Tax=Fusarium duplospermum TaxID=1325734 RepID=A0A428PSJ2_9HYPO|nr:hypothetical protein CEP54_009113 [Fusarium duplospermum]
MSLPHVEWDAVQRCVTLHNAFGIGHVTAKAEDKLWRKSLATGDGFRDGSKLKRTELGPTVRCVVNERTGDLSVE